MGKQPTKLSVTGKDVVEVLGIKPGPRVGEVLTKLSQEIEHQPENNNREYLLKRIKTYK